MKLLMLRLGQLVRKLKKTELKLYRCGVLFLIVLACRRDYPPKIELCQFDGFGGADCIARDGSVVYKTPEQLKNYLGTNPDDNAAFVTWCYQANGKEADAIKSRVTSPIR